eukprot:gnl/TRDRNA2_/TRDRNA2_152639_c0_seq1.p1 gnl/TRDRNA2_/TRDRNA2_152639_c0~~gnl/TRDRNA2_/TRDRNA2_152639_c0_seq1.p1  ORF type:complete len:287 (+),score=36.69 gnl/TRDRNA2_/TRDRNA2_152639_c0_seq1:34-861(+)
MEMTLNHLVKFLEHGPAESTRWTLPENQEKPRLVVTNVERSSYSSHVLQRGMVIDRINGQQVSNLTSFRKSFMPSQGATIWTLETDRGIIFATEFAEAISAQIAEASQTPLNRYLFTESLIRAGEELGYLNSAEVKGPPNVTVSFVSPHVVLSNNDSQTVANGSAAEITKDQAQNHAGSGNPFQLGGLNSSTIALANHDASNGEGSGMGPGNFIAGVVCGVLILSAIKVGISFYRVGDRRRPPPPRDPLADAARLLAMDTELRNETDFAAAPSHA